MESGPTPTRRPVAASAAEAGGHEHFLMPSLGADMDAGTIVEWRVHPGDRVHRGDIVAVVQTDKADIEAEVFADGTIDELLVAEGDKVAVGTPLARLTASTVRGDRAVPTAEGAPIPPSPPPIVTRAGPGAGKAAPRRPTRTWSPLVRRLAERARLDLATVTGTGPGGSIRRSDVEAALVRRERAGRTVRASPRARRCAADRGIALDSVAALGGSGPGGALTGDDVLRYAADRPPPPTTISPAVARPAEPARATARTTPDRASAQRRAIGALMARSKHEMPHYYLTTDVDLTPALDHLAHRNADRPPARRVLPAALLLQAVARAAVQVPGFNGSYVDGEGFVAAQTVDLGVALALRQGGLVAPTLPAADALGLDELMAALRGLVARARSGRLRASDTRAATLTVTNLGDRGARSVHGVIVPPQVALVGIGRVEPRPWVIDDAVVARQVVTLTLSADHRVTSGHEGSRFLDAIAGALTAPEAP